MTFPIFCPFGPKLFICNIPQLKEDLERNMEKFSKFCIESTVWFALRRNQKHSPSQTSILLVHARILVSLLLGLGGKLSYMWLTIVNKLCIRMTSSMLTRGTEEPS